MGILKVYADIMDEVPKLKKDYRLSYHEALRRAKEIYKDELEKAQSLTDQDKGNEHCKNNVMDILTDKVDLDNGYICDKETGQTIGELE